MRLWLILLSLPWLYVIVLAIGAGLTVLTDRLYWWWTYERRSDA